MHWKCAQGFFERGVKMEWNKSIDTFLQSEHAMSLTNGWYLMEKYILFTINRKVLIKSTRSRTIYSMAHKRFHHTGSSDKVTKIRTSMMSKQTRHTEHHFYSLVKYKCAFNSDYGNLFFWNMITCFPIFYLCRRWAEQPTANLLAIERAKENRSGCK